MDDLGVWLLQTWGDHVSPPSYHQDDPGPLCPWPQPLTHWSLTKLLSRHLLSGVQQDGVGERRQYSNLMWTCTATVSISPRMHPSVRLLCRSTPSLGIFISPSSVLLFNVSHLDSEFKHPYSALPFLEIIKKNDICICIYTYTNTIEVQPFHSVHLTACQTVTVNFRPFVHVRQNTHAFFLIKIIPNGVLPSPPSLSAAMTQKPARLKCSDFHQLLCSSIKGTYAKETSLWLLRAWGTSTCQTWGRNGEKKKLLPLRYSLEVTLT